MVVGQFSQDVDVLVIGGGPAGYTAAFRAAELDQTVAIVDPNDSLGGECLHHACIPSKSSLHDACESDAIHTLSQGLEKRCASLGIERLIGRAHFENPKTAQITGEVVSIIKFKRAIIASGSEQRIDSSFPNAIQVEELYANPPKDQNILVIGNTPSAVEASTFLANSNNISLWSDDEMLPSFHQKLVTLVMRSLTKKIKMCNSRPEGTQFDCVVLASHRPPHTNSLNLQRATVDCNGGFISVNERCQTSNPKIYAVGECVGCQHSAAFAITQGRVAAESACGLDTQIDSTEVPKVVWSSPEIAQCGTFDEGNTIQVRWGNCGLAVALSQQEGVTLLSFDPDSGAILGVGIAGTLATELISEGVLALEMGATLYDLTTVVRPHPTRSEMLTEAARLALSSL